MNFSLVNLGCKVNRVESDSFGAFLLSHGGCMTDIEDAQLVVINTCTVTSEAEKKTRKALRRVIRATTDARIVVTGCAAAINPGFYETLDERVVVVPKGSMLSYLTELDKEAAHSGTTDGVHNARGQRERAAITSEENLRCAEDLKLAQAELSTLDYLRVGKEFPTRVGVKAQDGCNHACSYCIVHTARGRATSKPLPVLIDEVQKLEEGGVREVVLTGIDLGSYYFEGKRLAEMLQCLLDSTRHTRFRISSIEPRSLTKDMIELIAREDGRICRHLHLPVQSGSSKILAEMNRPYSAEEFLELALMVQEVIPEISLSTDIIVGFPGETEQDFRSSCKLSEQIGFSKIHVFRYSPRAGTPAALRSDQVPFEIKQARAHELERLGNLLRQRFAQSLLGQALVVVVEKRGLAMAESYYHIHVDDSYAPGSVVRIVVRDIDAQGELYS